MPPRRPQRTLRWPFTTPFDVPGHRNRRAAVDPSNPVTPIRQVMLKLHSRCNLACTYCYVYRHGDQTWRDQPTTMSRKTIDLAPMRIGEHARRHEPPYVTVILHGGEPLLAGIEVIGYTAAAVRSAVSPPTRVYLHIQTNGVRLDDTFLDLFDRHG